MRGLEPEAAAGSAQILEPVDAGGRIAAHRTAERRVAGDAEPGGGGFGFDEGGRVAKGLVGITGDDEADLGGRGWGDACSVSVSVSVSVSASVSVSVSVSASVSVSVSVSVSAVQAVQCQCQCSVSVSAVSGRSAGSVPAPVSARAPLTGLPRSKTLTINQRHIGRTIGNRWHPR